MKAATRLQAIRDDWDGRSGDLRDALTYNRRLWTLISTSATREDNPLPLPIKQNIGSLGVFVLNHTVTVEVAPESAKLGVLVTINREIAAGLRALPAAA